MAVQGLRRRRKTPYTPAWQAEITSVPAEACIRIAREFAQNSEESQGRTMIIIGAGICHWFHADVTYRAIMSLLMLTGCIGRNGGGWAHYVGQEKCRPMTGWFNLANALDWSRPPRTMIGTGYWYMHTDQWRTDGYSADRVKSPLSTGTPGRPAHRGRHGAVSHRLGWMPFYPQFDRNPLDLADEAKAAVDRRRGGQSVGEWVAAQLKAGHAHHRAGGHRRAGETGPARWWSGARTCSAPLPRATSTSSSTCSVRGSNLMPNDHAAEAKPKVVKPSATKPPRGKLDLLISADFRMTSTTLLSDIVFPAATWYEKYDLSSTDMHPYVHAVHPRDRPAVGGEERLRLLHAAGPNAISHPGQGHGSTPAATSSPSRCSTTRPARSAQPGGHVPDWRGTDLPAVPGKNLPALMVVERDYTAIADKLTTVGPLADRLGFTVKNINYNMVDAVARLGKPARRDVRAARAQGRPAIDTDARLAEAILTFSGTTNGALATQGFHDLEAKTGRKLADLSEGSGGAPSITFAQTQASPQPVITSPEWSGSETGGRRYAAFTINTERLKPWHTLSGRMHFFLDHDWIIDSGEQLPTFRPPLDMSHAFGEPELGPTGEKAITLRYLTVHNKWSIHSEYQDNLFMLSLGRGRAAGVAERGRRGVSIGVADNDWIELTNANGVFVARAVVTHKLPDGICYVQHAQERTIDVPKSEATGKRGGIHNSVTRILVKPTHLIGAYAHQTYAFNYLGPTGVQRDIVSTVRRRSQEVTY